MPESMRNDYELPSLDILEFFQYRDFIPEGDPTNDPVKLAVALEQQRMIQQQEAARPKGFWARLAWLIRGDVPLSWRRKARRMLKNNASKLDREIDRGLAARLTASGLRGRRNG